ncbi:MAG TPA: malic enzyme-like NAD(P)-binding protein, partial [Solirubrobacteraceae bacterium]|nr:malic enzyme-like NAD(P)-binding protein [Solirubrobacteraceae bacterium]
IACTEILLAHGVDDIVVCDRHGALYRGASLMNPAMAALAERTNRRGAKGAPDEVLRGADLLLGVSAPGAVSYEGVRSMAADAIVFALANPVPEIRPEEIPDNVAIMATGRTDYPNQINNVLAFPGVFKGALKVRAYSVDETMKLAAAQAIADVIPHDELHSDYIVPSVFNRRVAESVADAVADAAIATGLARHPR